MSVIPLQYLMIAEGPKGVVKDQEFQEIEMMLHLDLNLDRSHATHNVNNTSHSILHCIEDI